VTPDSERILSHYRLVEKIGAGGMGVVYRGEDVTLKRPVALKFLTQASYAREDRRARFLREARLAAALNHPNICTIYEVVEVQPGEEQVLPSGERLAAGTPFIAMELIEGCTLQTVLRKSGPLPLDDLLRIALQVAEGLAAAHARAIIHRDLKPGNVMLTEDGRAKILDFGLAKPLATAEHDDEVMEAVDQISTELSQEGMVVGTAAYMSPEQALGERLDTRSDVFSFGTLLYEMVTGTRPFRGESKTSTLAKILEGEPGALSEAREDVPLDLERIVRRCLRKKPDERYNDTRDLVVALKDLQQETASGRQWRVAMAPSGEQRAPTGEQGPAARAKAGPAWTRHWALVAAVAAIAAAAAGASIWFSSRAPEPPPLPTYRRITFSGLATLGAISPDGQYIAYAEDLPDGGQGVFLRDLAGGQPLKIFEGLSWNGLRWSPDGSELLVEGERAPDDLGSFFVPRFGGDFRRFHLRSTTPAWSPDATRLAGALRAAREILLAEKSTGATSSIPLSGSFEFLLELDWSPTGDLLLFLTEDDEGRKAIWTISTDGGRQHKVIELSAVLHSPRWSPDGSAIYYLVSGQHTTELWKIGIDPGSGETAADPSPILTGLEESRGLSLSRDGNRLLYGKLTRRSNLWVVTPRGEGGGEAEEIRPLTSGTSLHSWPNVSPDGRQVAFVRGDNVHTMPLEGGPARQITFLESACHSPVWSPNGSWIAFGSLEGGLPKVWKIPAQGGTPRPFEKTQPSPVWDLAWAPGSRILYQMPGNRNFAVLDPDSEEESPLAEDDSVGWMFNPQSSPDGMRVAAFWNRKGGKGTGIWAINLEDGSGAPIHQGEADPIGWSADGESVYALTHPPGPAKILKVRAEEGDVQTLFEWPDESDLETCIADAERGRFVCTVAQSSSDIWLVEDFDPDQD
jgi:Tol biopolymer transport system component/tRNA A-37 threonylcarbamoyl transferase component Bud32